MIRFKLALAYVVVPLLISKTAHASFAYCIAINDYNLFTTAYGFSLWNEDGTTAGYFDTSWYNRGYSMGSNAWSVKIGAFKAGEMQSLQITNDIYPFDPNVRYEKLCGYSDGKRAKAIYSGCLDNGGLYCRNNYYAIRDRCSNKIEMGDYTVSCPKNENFCPVSSSVTKRDILNEGIA